MGLEWRNIKVENSETIFSKLTLISNEVLKYLELILSDKNSSVSMMILPGILSNNVVIVNEGVRFILSLSIVWPFMSRARLLLSSDEKGISVHTLEVQIHELVSMKFFFGVFAQFPWKYFLQFMHLILMLLLCIVLQHFPHLTFFVIIGGKHVLQTHRVFFCL